MRTKPTARPIVASEPPLTSVKSLNDDLSKLREAVYKTSKVLSSLMLSSTLKKEGNLLVITVNLSYAYTKLNEEDSKAIILDAAKQIWPNIEKVEIKNTANSNPTAISNNNNKVQSPPVDMLVEIAKIDEQAKQKVKQTPQVAEALEVFGGDVIGIE